ncbi:MAG: YihA family ribosome biogenesis GTP-binding protein [Lachnospiraceae bacterium]|nr:YihA family ribosome biogenesis GTP-binding protein [Lachnospiraceae bacterium]
MVIKSVNLETVVGITSKLPVHTWPEFAFAGRSNVGKSTLINGIVNRKNYAHTSGKPGKTQTINYYNVNDEFYLVDLPGYGYATAAVAEKAKWGKMIEEYLHSSKSLKQVFLIVDIRHEPSEDDLLMLRWIVEAGFAPVVIAAKADKIKRSQLQKHEKMIRESLTNCLSEYDQADALRLILWSGETKAGRDEIITLLEEQI